MKLIDSHCHIYAKEFDEDRAQMLGRAENEGVNLMLQPAIDSTTHEDMLRVEEKFPACLCMMGLHPTSVKENYLEELRIAESWLKQRKFVAIGETGLDFYWDLSYKKEQYAAFETQINWALEYDVPVVIHSRNSTDECIDLIKKHQKGKLKGVFHCFSGTLEQATRIIDQDFFLGIGGVVTFKNSGLDLVIEKISLDNILLETDAPYLAPVPFRGKRNECSYLKYVLEKIAFVKQITGEEVATATTKNACSLFNVKL
jgi:TatD DNase family protein